MAELLVITGPMQGKRFSLTSGGLMIGRHSQDISLHDDMVSRKHARVAPAGKAHILEDLGSRNGTFVNSTRVTQHTLAHGDQITIGSNILEFRLKQLQSDSTPPSPPDEPALPIRTITLDASENDVLKPISDETDARALQRARSDLAAIYQAGNVIASTLNVHQIYASLLDIIFKELHQADAASIHTAEQPDGPLVCKAHRERGNPSAAGPAPFSCSMSQFAMRERKAVLTFDALTDDQFNPADSIAAFQIRSAMCAPLLSANKILGVLQVHTLAPANKFDRDDLRLLTAFALQAGVALDNSMLYERMASDKSQILAAHEQLQRANETLIHSEKLAAVGRLAAGIIHDIKNPLTVILSHSEIMEDALAQDHDKTEKSLIMEGLAEIKKGVLHCNEVINSLLQFARQTKPSTALLDVNALLQETMLFVSHEAKKQQVSIDVSLQDNLPKIMADAGQIKQVFLNIIINAIQAVAQKKGTLRITTRTTNESSTNKLEIIFADDGSGMTEDVKRRLFEPFFTTKQQTEQPGGSGLGLAISYGIIQNHGGSIQVNSSHGKGTTFTISLPLALEQTQPQ